MYSPFRHAGSILRKKGPIHLTFFVTKRCNSKCPFCFYLKSTEGGSGRGRELDLGEISEISRSFGKLLWLAFSGGEIFLREDLPEISEIFYVNNKPAVMLFPTNGMLPELIAERMERILRTCEKSVVAVKLSLDGVGPRHDELRNTPGSFRNMLRTAELLGALIGKYPNFELGINTVFCSENQDQMDGIIDFVKGLENIKTHTISLVRGDLSEPGFKNVDYDKYLRAISRLEKDLKDKDPMVYRFSGGRLKAAQDIIQRRLIHRTMIEERSLIPCYAGRLNLVLNENGEVYPCEILTRCMGNIRDFDYDVDALLRSPAAVEIARFIKNRNCWCTHECYYMTNILFNPRLFPSLLSEYAGIRP